MYLQMTKQSASRAAVSDGGGGDSPAWAVASAVPANVRQTGGGCEFIREARDGFLSGRVRAKQSGVFIIVSAAGQPAGSTAGARAPQTQPPTRTGFPSPPEVLGKLGKAPTLGVGRGLQGREMWLELAETALKAGQGLGWHGRAVGCPERRAAVATAHSLLRGRLASAWGLSSSAQGPLSGPGSRPRHRPVCPGIPGAGASPRRPDLPPLGPGPSSQKRRGEREARTGEGLSLGGQRTTRTSGQEEGDGGENQRLRGAASPGGHPATPCARHPPSEVGAHAPIPQMGRLSLGPSDQNQTTRGCPGSPAESGWLFGPYPRSR